MVFLKKFQKGKSTYLSLYKSKRIDNKVKHLFVAYLGNEKNYTAKQLQSIMEKYNTIENTQKPKKSLTSYRKERRISQIRVTVIGFTQVPDGETKIPTMRLQDQTGKRCYLYLGNLNPENFNVGDKLLIKKFKYHGIWHLMKNARKKLGSKVKWPKERDYNIIYLEPDGEIIREEY